MIHSGVDCLFNNAIFADRLPYRVAIIMEFYNLPFELFCVRLVFCTLASFLALKSYTACFVSTKSWQLYDIVALENAASVQRYYAHRV